jgi:hypothetical protein
VLAGNEAWTAPMEETYALLGVDPATITTLDDYLQVRTSAVISISLRALTFTTTV